LSKTRTITMDEVAILAKVSKPTVSRALSGSPLVNAKTRERVLAVAREHGYAVNRNAQKLRHKRTNTIAVSIDFLSHRKNHVSDPFVFELLAGVSEALGNQNQDLLLTAPNHNDPEVFQQMLLSRGVDGFIFLGQGHREDMLDKFSALGAPMVVWGAKRKKESYCVIGSDNVRGGELAGQYLMEKGRRNILFVGDPSHNEIYWRMKGLKSSAENSDSSVRFSEMQLSNFSYESAYESAMSYFSEAEILPDGVFAYSDTAAMAIIHALNKLGRRVPEDVSVVGYNDIPGSGFFSPAITTIRQETFLAGELMVNKLMKIIDGKKTKSETIKTELIIRDT